MRTIGITGHTRGIGLGLANAFRDKGDMVFGYSRSNDYDLTVFSNIARIAFSMNNSNCDIAILNAHFRYSQIDLLYNLDDMWKTDSTKTIITLSSVSSDGIKNWAHPYAVQKSALDKAVEQLQNCRPYRLINIKPGYVDTPRVDDIVAIKLNVSDIVSAIMYCVDVPNNVLIKNLTITPR